MEEKGLTVETADNIGTFVEERGSPLELLYELKESNKFEGSKASLDVLDELEILFMALKKSNCIDKVVFDLSLARGLDYYTGVIFEAVFKGGTQVITYAIQFLSAFILLVLALQIYQLSYLCYFSTPVVLGILS